MTFPKKNLRARGEPTWLKEVSPYSALNTRDLRELLDISHWSLDKLILTGRIPPPDKRIHNHRFWYVETVRKFFKGEAK
jgi:hypothetical protein